MAFASSLLVRLPFTFTFCFHCALARRRWHQVFHKIYIRGVRPHRNRHLQSQSQPRAENGTGTGTGPLDADVNVDVERSDKADHNVSHVDLNANVQAAATSSDFHSLSGAAVGVGAEAPGRSASVSSLASEDYSVDSRSSPALTPRLCGSPVGSVRSVRYQR